MSRTGRDAAAATQDPQELLGRAESIVSGARGRGVHQVEVYLEHGVGLSVEIEKGAIATTSAGRSAGGAVRVVQDGRLGFAYFTDDLDAPRAIDAALRNAKLATVRGYSLPAAAKPLAMPGRWDDAIAEAPAAEAVRLARDVLAGAREAAPRALVSGGGVGLEAGACAIASSEGTACADRVTVASCSAGLVLEEGATSISTSESATLHHLGVDAAGVGSRAGETAMSLSNPRPVGEGGRFDVVLRPEVAAELVVDWMVSAAEGDEALRGKTVWSGKLGQEVAHPALSLVDDPLAPDAIGASPFDGEGLPVPCLPLVEAGVLRSYLFDSWDAHRHGVTGTRSAVRDDFKSRPTTGTHHLVLRSAATHPLDALIGGIDRGFLVDSVLGAHTANDTTGDFSVTSPNVWRIEKGALAGAVEEIALAGAIPDLLRNADAVSAEAKGMSGLRMPSLRLRDVDVSV